ncbi:hypothetical protein AB0F81_48245 [Actinoplanes sp. NPDC024001]|uniref:hypothetical protein n=1 Tax=Actinoplanes sp. NPDC024001 TaxID=3154598 RepID=UPI0033D23F27
MEGRWRRSPPGRVAVLAGLAFLLGVSAGVSLSPAPERQRVVDARTEPAAVAPQADRTVAVLPVSCRSGLDLAQQAARTLDEAAQAVGGLESARLQRALNRLQQAEQDMGALAAQCRAEVRQRAVTLP